jgi:hypothetical protein
MGEGYRDEILMQNCSRYGMIFWVMEDKQLLFVVVVGVGGNLIF